MLLILGYDQHNGGEIYTDDVGKISHAEALKVAQRLVNESYSGSVIEFPEYDFVRIEEHGVIKEIRKDMVDFRTLA